MSNIQLTNDQVYAVMSLESWWHSSQSAQVFEISGHAGVGKTVLIRYFIDRIGLKLDEVYFLTYMG